MNKQLTSGTIIIAGILTTVLVPSIGEGQISTINGSATGQITNTNVSQSGSTYVIDGGSRQGTNVFHSFSTFLLQRGDTAFFQGAGSPDSSVSNLFTRVQIRTVIDGTIDTKSFFSNANFWLMSPEGITVGPNAQFNVGGLTVNLTTANQINLSGEGVFFANVGGTSVLTSSPVASFGFTTPPVGSIPGEVSIQNAARLSTAPTVSTNGQTIAILAGKIAIGKDATIQHGAGSNARFEFATTNGNETIPVVSNAVGTAGTYFTPDNLGNNVSLGNNVTIDGGPAGLVRVGTVTRGAQLNTIGTFTSPADTIYSVTSTPQLGASKLAISSAQVQSVSSNSNTIEAGTNAQLTVTLNGRAGLSGVRVNVQNLDSRVSVTPTQDVVPKDQRSATFQFTGLKVGTASLSAAVPNSTPAGIANVLVNPVPVSTLLAPSLKQGDTGNLRVTLARPTPVGGGTETLTLTNTAPGILQVPSTVPVTEGMQEILVPVSGLGPGTGTLTATTGGSGVTPVSVRVDVSGLPLPPLPPLVALPTRLSIPANTNGALTVTLSTVSSRDVTVSLNSSNTGVAFVQPSVTIPAGQLMSGPITVHASTVGSAVITAAVSTSSASTNVQVLSPSLDNVIVGGQIRTLVGTEREGGNQNPQSPRVTLPFSYANELKLTMDRCTGARDGEFSSFVQRGRDRAPTQPGELLSSPLEPEAGIVEINELSFKPSIVPGRGAGLLNLDPQVAAFLRPNKGC